MYISQDPIGLNGGYELYAYVSEPNGWIDVLGLSKCPSKGSNKRQKIDNKLKRIRNTKGNNTLKGSIGTAEADYLGKKWVGDNHKVVYTKKGDEIWLSRDGTKKYRRPTKKPNSPYTKTGKQANYERDNADGSHDNAHIDIND